jgi:hypothetical protein
MIPTIQYVPGRALRSNNSAGAKDGITNAGSVLGFVLGEVGQAPVAGNVATIVSIGLKVYQLSVTVENNEKAMSKLKDLLSTDPNDKNSVWKPLQSAIDGLKNTNAGAAAELINIADVWEECQNALLAISLW